MCNTATTLWTFEPTHVSSGDPCLLCLITFCLLVLRSCCFNNELNIKVVIEWKGVLSIE